MVVFGKVPAPDPFTQLLPVPDAARPGENKGHVAVYVAGLGKEVPKHGRRDAPSTAVWVDVYGVDDKKAAIVDFYAEGATDVSWFTQAVTSYLALSARRR